VVWIINLELQGGSPHLSQLRINHLALVSKFDYVLTHTGYMESHKLCSFVCHPVGQYLTSLSMLYRIVLGHPRCVR
jgi:hypothetical protein